MIVKGKVFIYFIVWFIRVEVIIEIVVLYRMERIVIEVIVYVYVCLNSVVVKWIVSSVNNVNYIVVGIFYFGGIYYLIRVFIFGCIWLVFV